MENYNPEIIEKKWQDFWAKNSDNFSAKNDSDKEKSFILDMFPYPSGTGLHVGHVEGYTASDIYSRYARMNGKNVLHPIGWDAFGLPAENYAIKTGVHPKTTTQEAVETFTHQMNAMGFSYDWSREVNSSLPEYYKWTQWLFLLFYKNGLAYKKKAKVNWCPKCQTVLANEQAENGKCERCESEVIQKDLEQWFFRITDFIEDKGKTSGLLSGLEKIDWPNSTKLLQENWIGRSEGAIVKFGIRNFKSKTVLILHGTGGSSKKNWYPWMKKELESKGYDVVVPDMPHSEEPESDEWMRSLDKIKEKINENSIVIGHSLGCPAAWQFLEKNNIKIDNLILIAPTHSEMNWEPIKKTHNHNQYEKIKDFTEQPVDWEKIQKLTSKITVFLSENDPYIPIDVKNLFEKNIKSEYEIFPDKGHFNVSTLNMTEFPELLGKIENIDYDLQTNSIEVFTTRVDTIFGCTYCVVAPEHEILKTCQDDIKNLDEVEKYINESKKKTDLDRMEAKVKTGVEIKGIKVINPFNGEALPLFVADYVLSQYGTGAVMAVPAHDERDFEFAKKYDLPIKEVIAPYLKNNPREDKKTEKREVATAIVRNPKSNTYLCLDWKTTEWKSFPTGGIDGDGLVEAAKREVKEETGYKNLKFIKQIGDSIFSEFYRPHKDSNVFANFKYLLFDLENDEKDEVLKKEIDQHEAVWIFENDVESFINVWNQKLTWKRYKHGDFAYCEDGIVINSGDYDGLFSEEAREKLTTWLEEKGIGQKKINYKLRDWLVSRQRYWGAPIPIIYCEKCGEVPVPEKDLPVELPDDVDFKPTGESPLKYSKKFQEVKCPKCGAKATRESDTMDTFVCSSWYYLRYADSKNEKEFASKEKLEKWLPVDLYVGGAEHSVLHLLYARFFTKVLHNLGYLNFDEPFLKLRHQGTILAEDGTKMSKSKGNVVNPDDVVAGFGADSLRIFEMFMGPLEDAKPWQTKGIVGVRRFLEKTWKMQYKVSSIKYQVSNKKLESLVHKTIKKVSEDIKEMKFNTAISQLMILTNAFDREDEISSIHYTSYLLLLSPFAPHLAEELWHKMQTNTDLTGTDTEKNPHKSVSGQYKSVFLEKWPAYDPELIKDEEIELIVQVNGKVRDKIKVSADISEEEAKKIALEREKIKIYIAEKEIKKIIFVKGKLISIVI